MVSTNGQGANSGPATKTYVDAKIAIAPNDTNNIGFAHTFTVTVMEDAGQGAGFVAAAGETVTVSSSGSAGSITGGTCATTNNGNGTFSGTTNGSGQCTVIVNSNVAGSITVSATSDVSVGGVTLTRSTNGQGQNSGPATKTWVDGSLTWIKNDNNGNRLGGATFQVCR